MGKYVWGHIALISCFLIISNQEALSQVVAPGYTYEYWDSRNGVPSNSISDVEVLGNGYVWLSTYDGLIRFNGAIQQEGQLFSIYNKLNSSGFTTNRIISIDVVNEEEFFFRTEKVGNTTNIGHFKKGVFTTYNEDDGIKGELIGASVDRNGEFWVVSDGRVLRFEDGRWVSEFPDLYFTNRYPFTSDFKAVDRNNIWVSTITGLYHISNGVSKRIGKQDGLPTDDIRSFSVSSSGVVWIGTKESIHLFKDGDITHLKLPENIKTKLTGILKVDPTNDDRLIIDLNNGQSVVYSGDRYQTIPGDLIDSETGSLKEFYLIGDEFNNSSSDEWVHIQNKVFHHGKLVFQSQDHDITWVSTDGYGSFWYGTRESIHRIRIATFNYLNEINNQIVNPYSMIEDSFGTIWATGLSGQIYRSETNNKFSLFNETYELDTYRVYSLLEDEDRNMWFGVSEGLYFWDRSSQPKQKFYKWGVQVRGLLEDEEGTIWFGGVGGVYSINNKEEILQHSFSDTSITPSIRFIYEDRDGTIWFGTNGMGLLYFDEESGLLKEFEQNHLLSDTIIRSLYEDEQGIYWVGTEGSGLNRIEFNEEEVSVSHFNESNGLFGGVIHTIFEDDFERFWMSCNRGIFWVSKAELNEVASGLRERVTSIVYDETDGLPGVEANGGMQSTGFISSAGEFWFPMVAGVAWVNPNEVQTQSESLITRIEELVTADSTYNYLPSEIKLAKDQRNLQLSFVGFNYDINPQNIRFRYKLEDYDDEWNQVGSRNEAFYTNVPAGTYTFMIQTSVYGEEWMEGDKTLTITINPYFYETIVFYLLCALLVLGIGYLFYKSRIRRLEQREELLSKKVDEQTQQLKEQAERLLELDKAKSRFFANISHEFRTPLTLTIGPLEDISKTNGHQLPERISKKANMALRNSKRLLRLVNQILDISKIETGHLSAKVAEGNIGEYCQSIAKAFLGLSEKKSIEYSINIPEGMVMLWFDPDMMEKILGNLLSNAFKFTPKGGKITVGLSSEAEQVVLKVSDTGVGIPEEELKHVFERFYQTGESVSTIQAGTGIGLSLVKELVELHGGTIAVESKTEKGTTFKITFKKGNTHFEESQIVEGKPKEGATENLDSKELIYDLTDEATPELKSVDENRPAVLIIDDNEEIRSYVKDFLSEKYRVFEAENGQEGLEIAGKELPDMIICDVMMPVMDGYEFTKKLKSDEETDFIPVILLTAKAEQADKLEGLGIGANDYIMKPFDMTELLLKVENTIRSFKKVRAKFSSDNLNLNVEANSKEEEFIRQALELVQNHIDNEEFGVELFAEGMMISRAVLYTKMKEAVSKTPSEFIWEIRIEYAAELLRKKAGNITEIAYSSGFKSVAHFSRTFKKKFGQTPRSFLKEYH